MSFDYTLYRERSRYGIGLLAKYGSKFATIHAVISTSSWRRFATKQRLIRHTPKKFRVNDTFVKLKKKNKHYGFKFPNLNSHSRITNLRYRYFNPALDHRKARREARPTGISPLLILAVFYIRPCVGLYLLDCLHSGFLPKV